MDTNLTLDLIGLCSHDGVDVNQKVWYRDLYEKRAVFVENTPFYVFDRNDRVESQFCAVQLVEAGLATAKDVCKAFDISIRTFSRIRKLVSQGGIAALVKESRKGRRDSTKKHIPAIGRLYNEGKSSHEIARLLGVSTSTVLRVLKDQGVPLRGNNGQTLFEKTQLPTDHNNDHDETRRDETSVDDAGTGGDAKGNDNSITPQPVATDHEQTDHEQTDHEQTGHERSPVVSASSLGSTSPSPTTTATGTAPVSAAQSPSSPPASEPETRTPVEATSIAYASPLDRLFMQFGLIDEAPVQFESAESVAGAGALLGLALLEENGLLKEARGVYGSLQNCWYGLRPMIWTLLVMAWLRIKKPEQIKAHDPAGLGTLLGLPRTPEVKTIRRKLEEIADRRSRRRVPSPHGRAAAPKSATANSSASTSTATCGSITESGGSARPTSPGSTVGNVARRTTGFMPAAAPRCWWSATRRTNRSRA